MIHQAKTLIDDLLVILVLFKTRLSESAAYTSLSKSLTNNSCDLFIYDNSPEQQACISNVFKITYVHDSTNPGVSKAYNQGFNKAKELKKKWMLLVDQDTDFSTGLFEQFEKSILGFPEIQIFAPIMIDGAATIVSPFRFIHGRGFTLPVINPGVFSIDKWKFINSGTLVSTKVFELANGYDERFPLDFSDLVFIERLKQVTKNFYLIDVKCVHELSAFDNNFIRSLARFKCFVEGSKRYGEKYGSAFFLRVTRTLRAVRLNFRFKTFQFVKAL
jgi:GT2 family glycosyltransferase